MREGCHRESVTVPMTSLILMFVSLSSSHSFQSAGGAGLPADSISLRRFRSSNVERSRGSRASRLAPIRVFNRLTCPTVATAAARTCGFRLARQATDSGFPVKTTTPSNSPRHKAPTPRAAASR